MAVPHVTAATATSAAAQNGLIDQCNNHETLLTALQPFVRKPLNETVQNNVLQPDDHLTLALGPGTWQLDAYLLVAGPAAADFKCSWAFTGDAVGLATRQCVGPGNGNSDATGIGAAQPIRMSCHAWATGVSYGTDGASTSAIRETGLIQVTASGSVTLQWAQNTTTATNTTVGAGSWITAARRA